MKAYAVKGHGLCIYTLSTVMKYTTWPTVCGHLLPEHLIPKTRALIWSWSPLCCYNSLQPFGKPFYEMLEHCCKDLLLFSHKSISEVRHWCWAIRPGSQSAFKLFPKVFDEDEVRALCRPVKFFHTDLDMDLTLCTGAFSCWNRKGPPPICCHKVGCTK
jgi:hypothetical protein